MEVIMCILKGKNGGNKEFTSLCGNVDKNKGFYTRNVDKMC